ncbi:Protein ALTERED XYLOGLUCAN 4 [Diplonema papillatum]|nr:Protein ALTERED XYLOGLUCAN 4 [Diplonema papillatum]
MRLPTLLAAVFAACLWLLVSTLAATPSMQGAVQHERPRSESVHESVHESIHETSTAETLRRVQATPSSGIFAWRDGGRSFINTTERLCQDGAYKSGQWVLDDSRAQHFNYDGVGRIPGCCGAHAKAANQQRAAPMYKWVPDTCDLADFNEELFCKSLAGRDLIIVGDSINELWHFSIVQELGDRRDHTKKEGVAGSKKACPSHPICHRYYPKPLKLRFITNQLLQMKSTRRVSRSWWKYLDGFGLLVINAGAWMYDPGLAKNNHYVPVTEELYAQYMQTAADYLQQHFNGTIVFRTTYPGHPDCQNHDRPVASPQPRPYPAAYLKYRWEAIFERNEIAKKIFSSIGAFILDVEPMTTLRPDGHLSVFHPNNWNWVGGKPVRTPNSTFSDCLHYCIPGPMDTWTQLLMNLLMGNIS